jgi:hypothetical protein
MTNIKTAENAKTKVCLLCDFSCCKESDFIRHTMTRKHQILINPNNFTPKNTNTVHKCKCGKIYKHASSLCSHKQKCNGEQNKPTVPDNIDTNTILQIIQQNEEFKSLLIEQNGEFKTLLAEQNSKVMDLYKNGVNTTNNVQTINNNSNNKSFNLNVFLNETCKDAMNMKDFVDSIQITLTDIENMGKLGFVNGISNIIVNRLKAIDVHLRPVHCTDQRRETMYVKEKNQWSKEEEDNKNIRRFIQLVAHKNTKNLSLFKNKHPDCLEYHSKYNDQYNKIVMETFGGYGNTDYDSENKIIRKLVKELAIDKSN